MPKTRGLANLVEVSTPLHLTVVYEDGETGWVVARIREVPAAVSQGKTRDEARENVLDALRELVLSYIDDGEQLPLPEGASSEELTITLAR
jgi:predicted RNase H-like HicB family nuclease